MDMPEDLINTAKTIRSLRQQRVWSQEQLADIAGLSARTVQRLEQGQSPALETLKALAAAFEIPVSRLREGSTPLAKDDAMTETVAAPTPRDSARIFRRHLLVFTGVMSGLALINLLHNPEHPWVIYPALGWGIPLAIKALSLRQHPPTSAG
ncbi:MAG: helix-turn-helix domain-containing protein [Magnetospirillum sp.]|nr:helix-turn-helix domain-containing protein [Magnetospirillum sp.]